MQAIENLTRLRGRVVARQPHPQREGYELLTMHVDEAEPVVNKADLLSQHRGQELAVAVRSELLPGTAVGPGAYVDLRAKMTSNGALAEPHPEAGNFKYEPGPQPL